MICSIRKPMKMLIKICLTVILFFGFINIAQTKAVTVKPNSVSLDKAVETANPGDTIFVLKGKYKIDGITITKPLTIIGIDLPEIDANFKDEVFIIKSDNVTISGFYIRNTKYNFVKDNAAIIVDRHKFITIKDNIIENTFFAIYLRNSSYCNIINNKVTGYAKKEAISGNAIHLWYCRNITIQRNELRGHRDGIYLEFSGNCKIEWNISEANLRYGLHFMFSDSCKYISNRFSRNGAGAAVMYSKYINMHNNEFSNNSGTACYGLLLKDISKGEISHNTFFRNTVGIYAESTKEMIVKNNTFRFNAWALKVLTNSYDNSFTNNNFFTNSFEFSTNKGRFNNNISGNYWSEYRGYDLNGDGIGDVPHRPMTLFSYMSENYPSSLILNRSLFVNLLIVAESLLPSIIPKDIFDKAPRIVPIQL